MSDELSPPFREPERDEALEPEAEEFSVYDLASWVDEDDLIVGFTGMLKVIHPDGTLMAFHVGVGVNQFEAIGLHRKAIQEIESESEIDSWWGDD